FSMSRDGLLPRLFSRIHPRIRTPYWSSLTIGLVVAAIAGLTPIDVVAELTNIGTLAAFVLVSAAILILRRTQPDLRRAFRVPFSPVLPILSMLGSIVLIFSLPLVTIIRFLVWLAIGLVIYFVYSRNSSHLQRGADERLEEPGA
ncbi:MAG TPA: amino acid permease, partial [Ktedonobacteraceae bacterium]|nr:amino acid permease [Ktedonobacteraceae bacterium]